MQNHGGDIYSHSYQLDFSVNTNPLGPPPAVLQAACDGVAHAACYPDVRCQKLIGELARFEQTPEEWLTVGNGAADLIFSLVLAMKPKKALLLAPTFLEYEQALHTVDCRMTYHMLQEEDNFCVGETLLSQITEDLDLLLLCNPNNPTGLVIQPDLLKKIWSKCQKAGVYLVIDECFNDFLDEPEIFSMKGMLGSGRRLFLLKAFTKIYAVAGLRLGYGICGDADLLNRMREVRQPWSVSIPAQYAGIAAIREQAYVQKSRDMIRKERRYLTEELQRLGFYVYPSMVNYILFRARAGLLEACKTKGILIRDCSNYRGLYGGYYRIAVRTHEENEQLIKVLEEVA